MSVNRRDFMILSAVTLAAGCAANKPVQLRSASVDAGPASDYATDGVYGQFREQGFFVIRNGSQLFALSSICTHLGCKVRAEADRSFHCPCHGSSYSPGGEVIHGPAIHALPTLPSTVDANGHLIIEALSA